jgi:hypothetical protein
MVGTARARALGTAAAAELRATADEDAAAADDAAALALRLGAETTLGAVASGVGSPQADARQADATKKIAPTRNAPQPIAAA